jgi:hypothetical protein
MTFSRRSSRKKSVRSPLRKNPSAADRRTECQHEGEPSPSAISGQDGDGNRLTFAGRQGRRGCDPVAPRRQLLQLAVGTGEEDLVRAGPKLLREGGDVLPRPAAPDRRVTGQLGLNAEGDPGRNAQPQLQLRALFEVKGGGEALKLVMAGREAEPFLLPRPPAPPPAEPPLPPAGEQAPWVAESVGQASWVMSP